MFGGQVRHNTIIRIIDGTPETSVTSSLSIVFQDNAMPDIGHQASIFLLPLLIPRTGALP